MIELNPDRARRAGGADRQPHGGGRGDAGGRALVGPRRLLGGAQPAPRRAAPLARGDGAGRRARRRPRRPTALAVSSRLLQLDYAWRLGMDREEAARLERRGGGDRDADRRPALAGAAADAASARPGARADDARTGSQGVAEANRLADESGDLHLRVAIRAAGAYAYLCAADFERLRRRRRRGARARRRRPQRRAPGSSSAARSPGRLMGKGDRPPRARRSRARREELLRPAPADRRGAGRSRRRRAGPAARRRMLLAMQGEARGGRGARRGATAS